jgi:hypothetical protein
VPFINRQKNDTADGEAIVEVAIDDALRGPRGRAPVASSAAAV